MQYTQLEQLHFDQAGQILSNCTRLKMALFKWIPVSMFLCGMGLTGWNAANILGLYSQENEATARSTHAMALIVIGVIILLASLFLSLRQSSILNYWLYHIAKNKIKKRQDKLFDPDVVKSWFVAVIPRNCFETPTYENSTDIGFIAIDFNSKTILFEGGDERYHMPAQSILEYNQEYASRFGSITLDTSIAHIYTEQRYYFTVLRVSLAKESRELAFRILVGKGMSSQDDLGAANLVFLKLVREMKQTML
jgi:hypothetical protein